MHFMRVVDFCEYFETLCKIGASLVLMVIAMNALRAP